MLSYESLRSRLSYNGRTGELVWLPKAEMAIEDKRWNTRYAFHLAGGVARDGYHYVNLGRLYGVHILGWFYVTGHWPCGQIDHINRNRADNSWANLRLATATQNAANASIRIDNTSGVKGVSWHKPTGKWCARMRHNGRRYNIGYFDSLDDAAKAYAVTSAEFNGSYANPERAQ